jgi:magnesium chelatase subunit I
MPELPSTLGALKSSKYGERHLGERTVKGELRENLICKLQRGDELFPGVVGYDDTVVPQIVNAVLSRHNFNIFLTSPAAKSAIIRCIPSAAAAAI